MTGIIWRTWTICAVVLILAPAVARAQPAAASFDELRQVLKPGQTVVVTDTAGRRIKGKLAEVSLSPPALRLLAPGGRTFDERSVREIRSPDTLTNGALIGGAVGLGLAIWDYLIDPSEPGNAAIFTVAIGAGTAIGAGIDALIDGRRLLYRAPRRVALMPLASRHRQGVLVAVTF
jgi:hypothetical protein